jgi:hypothetical protein
MTRVALAWNLTVAAWPLAAATAASGSGAGTAPNAAPTPPPSAAASARDRTANRIGVELHPLDGYLLDGQPGKADAIAAALRDRSPDPRAQPFYRAFETVGARAADEALLALRLVLGGKLAADETIVAARAARARAKAGEAGARDAYFAVVGVIAR